MPISHHCLKRLLLLWRGVVRLKHKEKVPVNFMDRVVADNEFYRLRSEREVLQECIYQLDAAQNIGALRELLGTRIDTLSQRIALFEVEDGKKSIGDTGTG